MAWLRRRSFHPRPSTRPLAATASTMAAASSVRVRVRRLTAVRLEPMVPRTVLMSVTCPPGPTSCWDLGGGGGGVLAAGVDQQGSGGRVVSGGGNVVGVGDQEGVAGGGGELLGDAEVGERHGDGGAAAGIW